MEAVIAYVDDWAYKSPSVGRVVRALKKYAPEGVEFTWKMEEAELVVLHVYGRIEGVKRRVRWFKECGKKYAVVQYTLRGSRNPNAGDWMELWEGAEAVWSYLDLWGLAEEDGLEPGFNFYYAPLGVEAMFTRREIATPPSGARNDKRYVVLTSGQLYMTEGVRECIHAAKEVGRKAAHLGPKVSEDGHVTCFDAINDDELVDLYNSCDYVVGLRRREGFELCAAEGLCCGTRAILFDAPHYRAWYDGLGIFIEERGREKVLGDLKDIFISQRHLEVSESDREAARRRFGWERIIKGFYEHIGIYSR